MKQRTLVAACLALTCAAPAQAMDRFASPGTWARSYPGHVAATVAPLGNWERDFAVGAAVSLAVWGAAQADSTLERQVREHGPLGHGLDHFGSDTLPWLLVGGYLAPALAGDRSAAARWGDFEALIEAQAAQGLIVEGLKKAIDRRRPNGNRYAFPSGHTSFAFTSAGLIDGRYGHAAGAVAFAAAAGVATTRITLRRHWLSDTVAGAAVGTAVGELVAHAHRRERGEAHSAAGERRLNIVAAPSSGAGSTAVAVRLTF